MTAPAKFIHDEGGRRGTALSSMIAGGTIISGATLRRSLVFSGVRVHSWATVERAVVLPDVDIGQHARLRNVIIERGARIPPGLVVGEDPEEDARRFRRTDKGICLITPAMLKRLQE
jgi:glucose-1-phosphate adenylyltransferase